MTAEPDEGVATHVHPGEPEAFIILEGEVELHGAQGVSPGSKTVARSGSATPIYSPLIGPTMPRSR